ncbi:DUF4221 family protein [Algoriphagus halophilus]|uniref:DUF4221 family protein n=1 Tax=Algoriphagus halophilus TaxID=226505 RepID=UPI00358FBA60
MKKLSALFLISFIFSCAEKEENTSSNILESLTYSVDTVMVDPGDQIINLGHGARFSTVSLDGQKYYYYDYNKTAINEIDLVTLELTDIHQFSKEGPNSIGFNPPTIQPLSNDRFLFVSSSINVGTYFKTGAKEKV